ncbi:MAG: FAD-dependent oxidoreductase [bacterium]|nr:FAD-dependent oxidoreductase [bacterium]
MSKIKMTVNGNEVETSAGKTILEVVHDQGLDTIPTLCHSPELKPYGSCFLCVVEVEGRPNLVPSCATRVMDGMKVETKNTRIIASRKTALELLLSNHYADCSSPCQEGCPAHVDAQGYIALAAMGETMKAVELIREANPLPAVCGRICVRKCEVVCRREDVDTPVAINNIKRYVTDEADCYTPDPERDPDTGKTAGLIGSGPASLTAAWYLGRRGIRCTMYEALDQTGGMLRYGIPEYRLPDDVLDKEIDYILRAGSEIKTNVRVGVDITLDDLRAKHDAVFIGAGAWTGKAMRVEGEHDTEGVVTGADWLPPQAEKPTPIPGQVVVVVGGGNTAMDCARTAWRLDAAKVIVVYRRTKSEMPADDMEIEDLLEEGVEIMELVAPIGIVRENGKLQAIKCQRMQLGEPDDSGRRRPVPQEGSEFDVPCDLAISAIGQDTVLDGLVETDIGNIELTRWNTYSVNTNTLETNLPGVFAGGDAADDGPTVVIDAIGDGQRAAKSMVSYITGEERTREPFVVRKSFWAKPGQQELGDIPESPRHEIHLTDVDDRRNNFSEVATGFEFADNEHETARCLSCGCVRFDDCSLRLYGEEYDVDMDRYKGYVRKHKVDDRHPYVSYDPNKCILCSRCIRTCEKVLPISALGLVGRGFKTEMRPAMNDALQDTNCVSCGNCIDACPVGALTAQYAFDGRACLDTDDQNTHCGFCSIGCKLKVRKFGEENYFLTSSGEPGDYLCRYGRFGSELLIQSDRITSPMMRDGHEYREVPLTDATESIVQRMRSVAKEHGPESVAVFASPELTNEELYLAGRLAREGLGTSNVGSLAILSGAGRSGAMDPAVGFTASTADRSCLSDADLIICNNTAMESDHLVLNVDVISPVRDGGAKLIVSNSTLDPGDMRLSSLAVDPMRGRGSYFWNAVLQMVIDDADVSIDSIAGAKEFLDGRKISPELAAAKSGVDEKHIAEAANLIKNAKKVVIVHGVDRPHDAAPDDLEIFTNLSVVLNKNGRQAEVLLPRQLANSAGLEVMGADPAFGPGKVSAEELPGAANSQMLREYLEGGKIRAAIILGENPLDFDRPGSWFQNIEFLAAMDWTETETTRFADVTLPGSTFLESAGTMCNFEGRVINFNSAVKAPAGISGLEVLKELGQKFGLEISADLSSHLDTLMTERLGEMKPYYWNTGQPRPRPENGKLIPVEDDARASSMRPALTHSQKYRKEIREVGTERFRVQH